ncbi:MAG: hypothetical protein ABMA64_11505 [Myxococcota bacterium]
MSVLPPSLFEALEADASLWPSGEQVRAAPQTRATLERSLAQLPADVRQLVLASLVDPVRNDWSRAAVLGLDLAASAGARVTGLCTDDVIELVDARGERFGLHPIGFRLPPDRFGATAAVRRLVSGLDGVFGHRRYVLCVRRPIGPDADVAPVCTAVQLWLAQRDRTSKADRHAVYEDEVFALDFTVVEDDPAREAGGRIATFGPLAAVDRIERVSEAVTDAANRAEEAVGTLPLVVVAAADQPWALTRSAIQHRFYGLAERAWSEGLHRYAAEFVPSAAARFAHPALRCVASVWFVEAVLAGEGPLSYAARAWDNPWARLGPAQDSSDPSAAEGILSLRVAAPRFALYASGPSRRRVALRWERAGGGEER